MNAIEATGIINNNNILKINKTFSKEFFNKSVRVLIMFPDKNINKSKDIDEELWMKSISGNHAFDFLNEPDEDIYKLTDGKPFLL
jgi:hypothetical protein